MEVIHKQLSFAFCGLRAFATGFLLLLLLNQILYAETVENSIQEQDVKLIWSQDYGQGEQVYFSSYVKDEWAVPVQLSDSTEPVFHSSVSYGDDGRIWAVWSRQEQEKNFLEFTVYDLAQWKKPQQINTGLASNKAVTVIVDRNNTPWIAWSGIEKMYSDVYWSRWNGKGWDLPVKAHGENDVPDVDPTLVLNDSRQIILSWKTFNKGKYVTVSKLWDGQQWQVHDPEKKIMINNFNKKLQIPPVPGFINERSQATFFVKGTHGAESIPLSAF